VSGPQEAAASQQMPWVRTVQNHLQRPRFSKTRHCHRWLLLCGFSQCLCIWRFFGCV